MDVQDGLDLYTRMCFLRQFEERADVLYRRGLIHGPVHLGLGHEAIAVARRSIEETWNAEAKDRLERLMCNMVCDGQIDISAAQEAFATDWIAAYHTYYEGPKKHQRQRPTAAH